MNASAPAQRLPLANIAFALALTALACMSLRTIAQTDFWMHLATGRAIAEHGMGTADTLSTGTEGRAWQKPTWLYDVVMAKSYGLGGAGLVTLLHTLALLGAVLVLVKTSRAWASSGALAGATLLCAWTLAAHADARPELISLIFVALLFSRLEAHRAGWGLLASALPIQLVWANCDPSFVVAPLMALAYAIEAQLDAKTDPSARARAMPLFAAAGGLLLVPLLNPSFAGVYGGAISWLTGKIPEIARMWTAPFISPFVDEFKPMASSQMMNPVNWMLGFGALGLLAHKQKLPLGRTGLAILGAVIAVQAPDHAVPLFTVLVFPFLALSLDSLGRVLHELAAGGPDKPSPVGLITSGLTAVAALGTVVSMVSNGYYVKRGSACSFGLGTNEAMVPATAMAVINRPDFPNSFLNLPMDGGYIAWKSEGRKVYLDQRLGLHGSEPYKILVEALIGRGEKSSEAAKALFETAKPGAVILNCGAPGTEEAAARLMASNGWAPCWFDGATLILVQRIPAHEKLLGDTALQKQGLALIEQDRKAYAAALGGLRAAPVPPRLVGAAGFLLLRDQAKEALALYDLLQAGAPTMFNATLQKGVCLLRLDQREKAVAQFLKARDMMPRNALAWEWLARGYESVGKKIEAEDAKNKAKILTPAPEKKAA